MAVFINGVERNKENPETFQIPEETQKCAVEPGQWVKIGVYFNGKQAERFWCKVFENNRAERVISGVVDNDLIYSRAHGLEYGDSISIPYDMVLNITD